MAYVLIGQAVTCRSKLESAIAALQAVVNLIVQGTSCLLRGSAEVESIIVNIEHRFHCTYCRICGCGWSVTRGGFMWGLRSLTGPSPAVPPIGSISRVHYAARAQSREAFLTGVFNQRDHMQVSRLRPVYHVLGNAKGAQ